MMKPGAWVLVGVVLAVGGATLWRAVYIHNKWETGAFAPGAFDGGPVVHAPQKITVCKKTEFPGRAGDLFYFDIPAGTVAHAVDCFCNETGMREMYEGKFIDEPTTSVYGAMTAQEAMTRLLESTPLMVSPDTKPTDASITIVQRIQKPSSGPP